MLRRQFLAMLGLAAPAAVLLKQNLVNPLARRIKRRRMTESEIVAAELERIEPLLADLFERDDVFFKRIAR